MLANAVAITGLFISNSGVVVMTAGVLAIISGLYMLLKRWGRPVDWLVMLAAIVVATGSVVLTMAVNAYHTRTDQEQGATIQRTNTSTPSDSDSPSDGTLVSKDTDHTVAFEKFFTLHANEGLELDDGKGSIRKQVSDAKAPVDLYLSNWPLFRVSTKNFYGYEAPIQPTGDKDTDQYTACRNLVDTSQLGSGTLSSVTPDYEYCIITTKGRIALVTTEEMIDDGYENPNDSVSFTVKVWN